MNSTSVEENPQLKRHMSGAGQRVDRSLPANLKDDRIPSQVDSWLSSQSLNVDSKRGGVAQVVRAWDS